MELSSAVSYRHVQIDDAAPASKMAFCLTEDLTGNGRPDVIVGAVGDETPVTLPVVGRVDLQNVFGVSALARRTTTNVFWYENPSWECHEVANAPKLSVGGALGDLTGDGRPNLVAGQNIHHRKLWWFEPPADPRDRWRRRLITDDYEKYHDVAVADVDDDGEPEVVAASQRGEAVFYYDVPPDPRTEPWPTTDRHTIAEGVTVEGLAVTDVDGDGRTEVVAGPNVFSREADGWNRRRLGDWEWTRVAVADVDGDGDREIVLVEGDLPYQGDRRGRLGVFDPPDWRPRVIAADLSNPHSLQVADFDGDGHPEIFVAEMGLEPGHDPRRFLFRPTTGDRVVLGTGVPTHEATAVDLTGDGRLDIVGKAYTERRVDAWLAE